jgi:hypothetical protein
LHVKWRAIGTRSPQSQLHVHTTGRHHDPRVNSAE